MSPIENFVCAFFYETIIMNKIKKHINNKLHLFNGNSFHQKTRKKCQLDLFTFLGKNAIHKKSDK